MPADSARSGSVQTPLGGARFKKYHKWKLNLNKQIMCFIGTGINIDRNWQGQACDSMALKHHWIKVIDIKYYSKYRNYQNTCRTPCVYRALK